LIFVPFFFLLLFCHFSRLVVSCVNKRSSSGFRDLLQGANPDDVFGPTEPSVDLATKVIGRINRLCFFPYW